MHNGVLFFISACSRSPVGPNLCNSNRILVNVTNFVKIDQVNWLHLNGSANEMEHYALSVNLCRLFEIMWRTNAA